MAIIECGGVVTGIRGTVGGVTYAANKSGPYARCWSRGANPRTQSQSTERANLAALAAYWRTIDLADRQTWDPFAADPLQELTNSMGLPYYISGFQWFMKLSRNLASLGRAPIDWCPAYGAPAAPTILTLVVSISALPSVITYALNEFDPDYDCVIKLALGPSIGALAKPLTPLFLKGSQVPAGTSIDISTELADRFGPLSLGQKAFAEVTRQELWGRRSAPYAIAIDVIA